MTDQELNELKRSVPLWRLAEDRISGLRKQGSEYLACCPFHKDSTPSFRIYEKDGIWLFKCFGCSENGNGIQFVQKFDKITFPEAAEKVAAYINFQKTKNRVEQVFRPVVQEADKVTFPLSRLAEPEAALVNSPAARDWLRSRGITLKTAKKLHIGFLQSCKAVNSHHPWMNDGWMLFPSLVGDEVTLLKYRSVKGKKTPDGVEAIMRKKNMDTPLYNFNTIEPFEDVFIVEGEPDAAVMEQAGYPTVGYPNSTFKPRPHERERLLIANRRFLAGDSDEVGRKAMAQLWGELKATAPATYLIEWPEGCKDANDAFLQVCGGDVTKFQELIERLKNEAISRPPKHFYDIRETLRNVDRTNPMDDPKRLHFPWKPVDEMAVNRPGAVVSSYATATGTGKTSFWQSVTLNEAIVYKSVVVDYSAELSQDEKAQLITAILNKKDRLKLIEEDYKNAGVLLRDAQYYVGYNPDISKIADILGDGVKNPGILEDAIKYLSADIVILDHLHFFTNMEGQNATQAEAGAMTRIKNLAVKYNLIFIVIGQSRKANQGQGGKVSGMEDAKGSEAFSSTANTTYHLHRDKIKFAEGESPKDAFSNKTDIRLYKCRTKGPGNAYVQLWFEGANGRFSETLPASVIPQNFTRDEEDYGQHE